MLGFDFPTSARFKTEKREKEMKNAQKLDLNQIVLLGQMPGIGKDMECFIVSALVHEPPRGEWHEKDTDTEDNSGDELEGEWNSPCRFMLTLSGATDEVGAVVNPKGDHDTERDGELLEGDERAANFWGGEFGAG